MIVEYIRYEVEEARSEEFVAAYDRARGPLMESPHCRSFELCRCVEEPAWFLLRIEWTSAEDHMERFRGSDEFKRFFAEVRPFYESIREMRHYERLLDGAP